MNDVRLFFPFVNRELWTRSTLLASASPYFKTLLASKFSEGISIQDCGIKGEKEERPSKPVFLDSDDESDDALPPSQPPSTWNSAPTIPPFPYHNITVREASYTTYAAVLVWIQSRHIQFAPLLFNFPSHQERLDQMMTAKNDSTLPFFPSPKSVFRLAHFLEIEELKSLALESIRTQLTAGNAIYELFSDASKCYEDVQQVVMDFVVDNWETVKINEWTVEVETQLEEGDEDRVQAAVARILLKLAKRLKSP